MRRRDFVFKGMHNARQRTGVLVGGNGQAFWSALASGIRDTGYLSGVGRG